MSDQANQVSELKVSGHTMALEPGLYCIFSAPGGPQPAPDTGLPTVRISAVPGRAGGQVTVAGLHADGWIGPDSATLVRVSEMRADVLVTVYQAPDTKGAAPQLQVVKISGEPGAEGGAGDVGAAAALAPTVAEPGLPPGVQVQVMAHIYARGDVGGEFGSWIGEPGSTRWIEGFGLAPVGAVTAADIEYQAVLGRGWLSPWAEGGQFCGSRAMSLPILGMRVRLKGKAASTHRIVLSATFVDGSTVGPVGDGEACEAPSLAALEAFQIAVEPVGGVVARSKAGPKAAKAETVGAAVAGKVGAKVAARVAPSAKAATTTKVTATAPKVDAPKVKEKEKAGVKVKAGAGPTRRR